MAQTTVNIDTDITEELKKLDEMIEKLKLLEDKSKMLNFITIADFAKLRQCSIKTAQDIFNSESFPAESYRQNKSSRNRSRKKLVSSKKR